nr:hypothetical protein [uncultured Acetatifactor sp.]
MIKFRNAYREAAGELPEFHMEASQVQDELHHHRMRMQRRRYLIARGCTAAAVFLLFGAGTVAAKNLLSPVQGKTRKGSPTGEAFLIRPQF